MAPPTDDNAHLRASQDSGPSPVHRPIGAYDLADAAAFGIPPWILERVTTLNPTSAEYERTSLTLAQQIDWADYQNDFN
jgi:hypothetical protein